MTGLTLTVCIGKYAGFYLKKLDRSISLCLGWIAIRVFSYDREHEMHNLLVRNGLIGNIEIIEEKRK